MTKPKDKMKDLIKIVLLGSALSLWAGAAGATAIVELSCGEPSCQFTEEIGPSGTKTFHGHCNVGTNTNSKMVCHKAKGLTCTTFFYNARANPPYMSCTCTNWNAVHEAHPDIDLTCPPPN